MKILRALVAMMQARFGRKRPLADVWDEVTAAGLIGSTIDAHPRAAELIAILRWSDVGRSMRPPTTTIPDVDAAREDFVLTMRDAHILRGRSPAEAHEIAIQAAAKFVARHTD